MISKWRWKWLVLGVLVIGGLLALFCRRPAEILSFSYFAEAAPVPSTDRYKIQMTQDGQVKTDFGANDKVAATKVFFKLSLKGVLELARGKSTEGQPILFGRLLPEQFSLDFGSQNGKLVELVKTAMMEPFLIFKPENGLQARVMFSDKNRQIVAQNILNQILNHMYFELQTTDSFKHSFLNFSENAAVSARSLKPDQARFDVKPKSWQHRVADFRMEGQGASVLTTQQKGPAHIVELKTSRNFKIFRGASEIQKESFELGLHYAGKGQRDWIAGLDASVNHWKSLKSQSADDTEIELLKKIVDGKSYEQLKAELLLQSPNVKINEIAKWVEQMIAYLKLHPEAIKAFAQLLDQFSADDQRFDIVGVILVQTGHADGQKELIEAMRGQCHEERNCRLLSESLALYKDVSPRTVQDAMQIYEDAAESSAKSSLLMSLSGMGYHVDDGEAKNKIYALIEQAGQQGDSVLEHDSVYQAYGNLGHPKVMDHAKDLLKSSNARERINGSISIRRVEGKAAHEVDKILTTVARKDPDLDVRRKVSRLLVERKVENDELEMLASGLSEERDVQVTLNFVDAIGRRASSNPRAREILVAYFQTCSHTDICQRVQSYILH